MSSTSVSRPPTINDVAAAAGVSRSTSARALRGNGYVAAAVRQRVLSAAEQLGYVPNTVASSLRSRESGSIGVLVSDLRDPFYSELAAGIAHRAQRTRHTMVLLDDRGSPDAEMDAARVLVGMRVAGVVVTPLSERVGEFLARQNMPFVEADRTFTAGRADVILVDNAAATAHVLDLLLGLGHRRIALLADETEWTTGAARYRGYIDALDRAGIGFDPGLVARAGSDVAAARGAAVAVLAHRDRPSAVFCANSVLAEGLWRAAGDLGLRVPDDLSVISFDDAPWMSLVVPGVTAVAQDTERLGAAAMDRLLDRVLAPDAPGRDVVVEATLIVRGSTAPPRPS